MSLSPFFDLVSSAACEEAQLMPHIEKADPPTCESIGPGPICLQKSVTSSLKMTLLSMSFHHSFPRTSPNYPKLFLKSQIVLLSFFLFRATPIAYGSSQARGRIGAVAASLRHSHINVRSELHLQHTPQPAATLDP